MNRLEPSFVDAIPEVILPGTLYVSIRYATVVHSCCCGCEEEVVTPLTPTDWRMTFDGVTVSLAPSVGSWSLPCRSHYVVDRGQVRWADAWTQEQIDAERRRDRAAKAAHYDTSGHDPEAMRPDRPAVALPQDDVPLSRIRRLGGWLAAVLRLR